MRKPDFHRENPEQRISIVLGGVVLRAPQAKKKLTVYGKKKRGDAKINDVS